MRKQEAVNIGKQIRIYLERGAPDEAFRVVFPLLNQRIPFPRLEDIGQAIVLPHLEEMKSFLDHIAATRSEGGWVIIATVLRCYLDTSLAAALHLARDYVVLADVWYACDIFGERVPGTALLKNFRHSLVLLDPWRNDPNPWVRRTVGVAIHYWAKRTKGQSAFISQAQTLLDFLIPLFEEQEMKALKGIGWALKTMGRYYPEVTAQWLLQEVHFHQRKPRALMLKKAITYLPPHLRTQVVQEA